MVIQLRFLAKKSDQGSSVPTGRTFTPGFHGFREENHGAVGNEGPVLAVVENRGLTDDGLIGGAGYFGFSFFRFHEADHGVPGLKLGEVVRSDADENRLRGEGVASQDGKKQCRFHWGDEGLGGRGVSDVSYLKVTRITRSCMSK